MSAEYKVIGQPKMEPSHPGALIARELEFAEVSVMAASEALGVSRQTLHRVLAGTSGITSDMAVRLGAFLGNGPGIWLRMQAAYDLWHAERATKTRNVVPIAEARKLGAAARKGAPLLRAAAKRAPRRTKAKARA